MLVKTTTKLRMSNSHQRKTQRADEIVENSKPWGLRHYVKTVGDNDPIDPRDLASPRQVQGHFHLSSPGICLIIS